MTISYTNSLSEVRPEMLSGFFEGWRSPPSPEKHLRMLQGSRHVILAIDDSCGQVIGFINALTDGCNSAFIPLLEVLPNYRRQGIGSQLVMRMLDLLRQYPCIDLTCDPQMQPFYEKLGMLRSSGMVVRDYSRTDPK